MEESFMRRTTFALLATVSAVCLCLFTASVAGAQSPAATVSVTGSATTWSPDSVTVTTGQTVRWSFNGATLPHNVRGTSPNWNPALNSPIGTGQGPVDYTFNAPGVYTFICDVHGSGMSGTVTVQDPGADPLENVLVFSKTAGFRHDSIPQGIAAIQALGTANDFEVDATEDAAQFTTSNLAQYDAVVFLSTTGDVLNAEQQDAFESYMRNGGGYVGIHAAADTEYEWGWYGQMLGGYFRNHPAGTPQATVHIEDTDEPSTEGLPVNWSRIDEWYNYQSFETPSVGGGGDDYSVRDSDVKVLATMNEGTYDEDDGTDEVNDDHPIAWCSDFDGGRFWYTGLGHTAESFGTGAGNIRSHILGGLQTATRAEPADCGQPREATPDLDDFELVTIDDDTESPMELAVANDGRVFYVERITGELNVYNPTSGQVTTAITIPVSSVQENGAMGIALDPNFDTNNYLYVTYTPPTPNDIMRVSRFTVGANNVISPASEQFIYQWTAQRAECCHSAGSLAFGPTGDLYISTGDNTNPFASDGFTPIDERPGRAFWDAQRTSANSNNPMGKILRIHPLPGATGTPGVGTTYSIPTGNMFAPGTAQTLPEIYAMGFRNPFRITIDPNTGWVLLGNYGPDAGQTVAGRGPQGSVEFEVIKEPGFYGWPYCVRNNVPYNDYNFANNQSGPLFNCNAPVNNSPNNTGITNLPAAKPAAMWLGYTETDPRVPGLGGGGAPTGGPRYQYDPDLDNPAKFPEFYDEHWFIGEWNNGWLRTATLNANGDATGVFQTPFEDTFFRPHEIEFGPDGALYVIDWGSGFNGNNQNSGIYRIDYVAGARRPIARATSDKDNGPTPLTVQFSSDGSQDPDETPLTYAWDFDGNGTTDSTLANPTHTYTTAGTFNATLTVTDGDGQTGFDTIPITAGNTRPTVTITVPEDGQFAAFGDIIPYEITVTDPEDGTISCSRVSLNVQLGHDDHAHPLQTLQGCSGTFRSLPDSGHGANANIFTSIVASYTDNAQGAANPLTGQDDVVIQPKPKQAEFFDSTGRVAGSPAGGDPGVQTENTGDAGGGLNIGFIERGDYVSFERVSLEELTGIRFRVASGGAGGTIEARLDSPTGPLAGSVAVAPTGGWQNWTNVTMDLGTPPEGTHELFLVFTHPSDNGGLFNINHFTALGKGAANSAAPEVTAAAEPMTGDAPLQVQFTGTATDPDAGAGEQLTYLWDFGVAGTTDDTSTQLSPTYTYERPGTYLARFTATDPNGASATASVQVEVTSSGECPANNVKSDEFNGDSLDTNRWQIIRPDSTRAPTVSGGSLNFPIDVGSLYGPGTSARNIIVQPLPDGEVEVTAKITTEPLTQNYQQAGLRIYQDDNNWASIHMIYAGSGRDFEFIYENNGNPRNEAADKLGGIPVDAPLTYWVKLISDGSSLRAEYSYDGDAFSPVGRVADISGWSAPQVGPVALSDAATTYPVASFDWIRFNPDSSGGGGGGGGGGETEVFADEFNGTDLGAGWDVIRRNQALTVSGSAARMPAATGDLYQGNNTAANLAVRAMPSGPWTATAKINFEGVAQYQQAGIMVYGDDDNLVKLGRIAHTTAGDEKFEFIHEAAAVPDNTAADSTANIAANFPDDYWVQLRYDGTSLTGWYSPDGTTYTQAGRAWPLPTGARVGFFAFGNTATSTAPEAAFDSFRITGPGAPAGPRFDDEFDGSSLDKERWNAIVRDTPAEYEVAGGEFTITTSQGDIYTGDTNPPPNNFILQDAAHAGADWTIETKIPRASIIGEYAQGGLIAYVDGNNYVKLDVISDDNNTRINRIELRSEVAGAIANPQENVNIPEANDDGPFYLRLTKAGTNYSGEYSFDGATWTAFPGGSVANPMQAPDFGLFAFSPQPEAVGDTVTFDYFWLDGQDPPSECECPITGGDTFDGPLDKQKWNAIVREDESLYRFEDGWMEFTTVNGDIYTNGDPAGTRNFILQNPTEAGQDWVIETHIDASTLSQGYEQAGLMARLDDDNYIKYDVLSDDTNTWVNRIELRSEVAGQIVNPQPQVTFPENDPANDVWLRLTKSGNNYTGEYSRDGETWLSIGAPVANAMVDPAFGIFTLGVNSGGGTPRFEYFSLDGNAGECEEPDPENRAPVIEDASATPASGFAPLQVAFSVTANDPDEGDTLTYAWDFDGDGDTDSTAEDPSYTYTAAGEYDAEVTVSDGEDERSRTVPVTVFGPTDPGAQFRVLVFSKTAGFRHDSIDEGHAAIEQLGEDNDFQVDHTEDAAIFNDDALENYDTVVFLSTTGDVLNDTQQAAFERYIQAGGGYTGIHSAADTEYTWPWYGQLVGAYFRNHPPGTPAADVMVVDPDDPSTDGLPLSYNKVDEWYNYQSPVNPSVGGGGNDYNPRNTGVHVLMTVDESDYVEEDGSDGVDDEHPISWCRRYDGGRSWYTGMGHTAASFSEANYLTHILGGIEVTAGAADSAECGATEPGAPVVEGFADPASGSAPLEVQFSSTAADPDGDPLIYRWSFGDGGSALGSSPVHTYTTPGTYTATVTVRDPDGNVGTDTVEITVNAVGNQIPMVVTANDPSSGDAPLPVTFQAQAIDPDGPEDKLVYRWDFGDGGALFGRNVKHTYMEPGTYKAKVTVTDAGGASVTSDEITITVNDPPGNRAPSVQALADPKTGTAPLRVTFSSAASDPDGDQLLSVWDFGDGVQAGGESVAHTYTQPGTYNAKITVRDPKGLSATATVQIVVRARTSGGTVQPPPNRGGVEGEETSQPLVKVNRRYSVARVIKRGLRYTVTCEVKCRVSSTLRLQGERLGKSAARRIAAGQSRKIVVRLDRNVRRNLVAAMRKAHVRTVRATLVLKVSTSEGTKTIRKAVTLRR
jgi:PKD repeat protein/plastocyanin